MSVYRPRSDYLLLKRHLTYAHWQANLGCLCPRCQTLKPWIKCSREGLIGLKNCYQSSYTAVVRLRRRSPVEAKEGIFSCFVLFLSGKWSFMAPGNYMGPRKTFLYALAVFTTKSVRWISARIKDSWPGSWSGNFFCMQQCHFASKHFAATGTYTIEYIV